MRWSRAEQGRIAGERTERSDGIQRERDGIPDEADVQHGEQAIREALRQSPATRQIECEYGERYVDDPAVRFCSGSFDRSVRDRTAEQQREQPPRPEHGD